MDNTEPTIGLLEVTPQGDDAVEQEVLAGLQTADDIDPTLAAAPAGVPARNLVVSQLPKSVDTQMLRQIFGAFGQLVTALVMMDVQNGKSRGFGFVWFERVDDATAAIAAMNGKVLEEGSKPVKVFPSVHPDGLSEAPTIVVLNFPAHLGAAQARPLFEKFGIVKRFQIINDNTARLSLSGSGTQHATAQVLVEFAEVLDARKAVNALHGVRQIQDGPIAVNLALPLVTKYELPGSRPPPRPTPPARPKAGTPSSSYTGGSAMGGSVSTTHGAVQQYAYPLQTNSLPGSGTAHPYSTAPAMANPAAPMHYFVQPPHVMAAPGGGLMYVQPQAFSPPPNAMHSGSTPPQPMFFAPQPNPSPGFVVMQQQPQFAPMPQAFQPQQQPGAPQQMFFVPQANSPMTFAPPPMQASQPPQWMQAPVAQHHPFHPFAPAPPQQPY